MTKVTDFITRKTIESETDKRKLDVNNPLDFTELFKIKLMENPNAKTYVEKYKLWRELADQVWLLRLLPEKAKWFWFSRELDFIDTEHVEG